MDEPSIIVNGWTLIADPCFIDQVEKLRAKVQGLQQKYPELWVKKDSAKRLAALTKLFLTDIPQDPTREIYRQGNTLGPTHKHWFRAKFYQQYRLFFRYSLEQKVIVFGWVNDPDTKRAYDSKTDAYRVFRKMLEEGHPPDNWNDLIKGARAEKNRLRKITDEL
ncbi:MAG: type II toxin-antitoxin system YhaV family toxin [Phormidesmis sp.]